jgi:hypothetical protein
MRSEDQAPNCLHVQSPGERQVQVPRRAIDGPADSCRQGGDRGGEPSARGEQAPTGGQPIGDDLRHAEAKSRPYGVVAPPWFGNSNEFDRAALYEQDGQFFEPGLAPDHPWPAF